MLGGMQIRLLRWGRGLLVVGLALLGACDPRRQSVADEEPADAGADAVTAAPMCPYAPMPLGACEGFQSPEPACTVDIEGRTVLSQRSFDATGRLIGATDFLGVSRSAYDETGRLVVDEHADDGCVSSSTVVRPLGDGWLTRRRSPSHQVCLYQVERDGELILDTVDLGCDCHDVITLRACEVGPEGPVSCTEYRHDGTLRGIWRYTYEDAGRRVGQHVDHDGDGVPEYEEVWAFDAEGRAVEYCTTSTDGDEVEQVCWSFTYEERPRRVVRLRDAGADGSAEDVWRTTYDEEDRVVLDEHGTGDVVTWYSETVYDERGGYRRTRINGGRVTGTEAVVIVDGQRTWTRTSVYDDGETVDARVFAEHDGLIERVRIERDGRGELIELRHHHYSRDARGLVIGERVREVTADGLTRACTVAYRWSGPCPVPPVDYEGADCAVIEP